MANSWYALMSLLFLRLNFVVGLLQLGDFATTTETPICSSKCPLQLDVGNCVCCGLWHSVCGIFLMFDGLGLGRIATEFRFQ